MLNGKLGTLAAGALLGTALMYTLDPVSGRRRRALATDKFNKYKNKVQKFGEQKTKDFSNRAQGFLKENQAMLDS